MKQVPATFIWLDLVPRNGRASWLINAPLNFEQLAKFSRHTQPMLRKNGVQKPNFLAYPASTSLLLSFEAVLTKAVLCLRPMPGLPQCQSIPLYTWSHFIRYLVTRRTATKLTESFCCNQFSSKRNGSSLSHSSPAATFFTPNVQNASLYKILDGLKCVKLPWILPEKHNIMYMRQVTFLRQQMSVPLFLNKIKASFSLSEKVGKVKWEGETFSNSTSRSEPGWKIAASTNSFSTVHLQRQNEWSDVLWHTIQWEAASQNCLTNWAERRFHIEEFGIRESTEDTLRSVVEWRSG